MQLVRVFAALVLSALLAACGQPLATAPTGLPATAPPAPAAPASAPAATLAPSLIALWSAPAGQPGAVELGRAAAPTLTAVARFGDEWIMVEGPFVQGRVWVRRASLPAPVAAQLDSLRDLAVRAAAPVSAPRDEAAPASGVDVAPDVAPPAPPAPDLTEDQRAQRDAQAGPAPRDLPPDVAAAPACLGPTGIPSPICHGITNGAVERLAREAEARGDYVEAARLRNWLPQ